MRRANPVWIVLLFGWERPGGPNSPHGTLLPPGGTARDRGVRGGVGEFAIGGANPNPHLTFGHLGKKAPAKLHFFGTVFDSSQQALHKEEFGEWDY